MIPPEWFLTLSAVMFTGGLFGVLTQRNAMRILISVEVMLNSANVAILAFNGLFGVFHYEGWILALIIIGVAAAEAAIGLAIFLSVYRNFGEITVSNIFALREDDE